MKTNDFIKNLAVLSGIKEDDANLVKLLESTKNIDVDDTIAATINSSLHTIDAAKNNPTLKSHFTGQALSTVDSKIEHLISQYGLEEEDVNELKGIKSSYDRLEKVTEKIAKLTEKKAGKSTGDNTKAIAKLETEKAELIKKIAQVETDKVNEINGFKKNYMVDTLLAGMQYTLPEGLSATEKTAMVRSILNKKLDELGVVLDLDNDKLVPKKDGLIYYKNNQSIGTEDLIKSILTEKKLVKVAEAPKNRNTPQPVRRNENDPPQIKVIPDSLDSELERQINSFVE